MKTKNNIFYTVSLVLILTSCASAEISREGRQNIKAIEAEHIRRSVETNRFRIDIERINPLRGSFVDLVPGRNYVVLSGDKARMSLGYLGRSYDARGIAGINVNGTVTDREVKNSRQGGWDIKMKVSQGGETLDVYISISTDGNCSVSINNPKIEFVRYYGQMNIPELVTQNR